MPRKMTRNYWLGDQIKVRLEELRRLFRMNCTEFELIYPRYMFLRLECKSKTMPAIEKLYRIAKLCNCTMDEVMGLVPLSEATYAYIDKMGYESVFDDRSEIKRRLLAFDEEVNRYEVK